MLKSMIFTKESLSMIYIPLQEITSAPECDENVLLSMPTIQQDEIE